MGTCDFCNQDMLKVDGCVEIPLKVKGKTLSPIPFGQETRYGPGYGQGEDERCHDCFALTGKLHHRCCDVEECPNCHRQLIGCGCPEE